MSKKLENPNKFSINKLIFQKWFTTSANILLLAVVILGITGLINKWIILYVLLAYVGLGLWSGLEKQKQRKLRQNK